MLGILDQLLALPSQIGAFGIRLRAHRYILAGRHRHGAGDQACDAGDQDRLGARPRGGHAQDEARGGDDAVVCAEDGRAEPADPLCPMSFNMSHDACFVMGSTWRRLTSEFSRRRRRSTELNCRALQPFMKHATRLSPETWSNLSWHEECSQPGRNHQREIDPAKSLVKRVPFRRASRNVPVRNAGNTVAIWK